MRGFLVWPLLVAIVSAGCNETAVQLVFNLEREVPREMDALCLSVAGRGATLFGGYYALEDRVGVAQTMTVIRGDRNRDRFEVIFWPERYRIPQPFSRLIVDFEAQEILRRELSLGACGASKTRVGTAVFEKDGPRLTTTDTGGLTGLPVPGFSGVAIVPWADASDRGSRLVWAQDPASSRYAVFALKGGIPSLGRARVNRVLPIDLDSGGEQGVCAIDLLLLQADATTLWRNDGAGAFSILSGALPSAKAFSAAVVVDLDHDGRSDVVLASPAGITVWRGKVGGTFEDASSSAPATGLEEATALAVGDLNGDMKPDLVVGRGGSNAAAILLNDGQGRLSLAPTGFFAPAAKATAAVAVARLDRDALDDIVLAYADEVVVYGQKVNATGFSPLSVLPKIATDKTAEILAADVDRDCFTDLILMRPQESLVLHNGAGKSLDLSSRVRGGTRGALVDFDGDGLLDLLIGGHPSGSFVSIQRRN